MEENLWLNRDWDPMYLSSIFDTEFNDFTEMWACSNVTDGEIIAETQKVEAYCPITEDISLDDNILCTAIPQQLHWILLHSFIVYHYVQLVTT